MLRLGGNEDDTRMVIAAAFQKQKSTEDIAALLQSTGQSDAFGRYMAEADIQIPSDAP